MNKSQMKQKAKVKTNRKRKLVTKIFISLVATAFLFFFNITALRIYTGFNLELIEMKVYLVSLLIISMFFALIAAFPWMEESSQSKPNANEK